MLYDEDESIKGDAQILARGSSSLLAKEQLLLRIQEFLDRTNNPVDLQILGIPGRTKLLREAARMLEINVDDILPNSKEELAALVQRIHEEEQAKMQSLAMQDAMSGKVPQDEPPPGMAGSGQAPPAKSKTLDNAGNPAGGMDHNVFQNRPGVTP